jgi:hypothetical protein
MGNDLVVESLDNHKNDDFKNTPVKGNENGSLVFSPPNTLFYYMNQYGDPKDYDNTVCAAYKNTIDELNQWMADGDNAGCPNKNHVVVRDYKEGDMLYGTSNAIDSVVTSIKAKRQHLSQLDLDFFRRNCLNSLLTGGVLGDDLKGNFINSYKSAIELEKKLIDRNDVTYMGRVNSHLGKHIKFIDQFPGGYQVDKNLGKKCPVSTAFCRASKRGLFEQDNQFISVLKYAKCNIFYMLDGINIAAVANKEGRGGESIVSSEIRFLYRLAKFDNVKFPYLHWVLNGKYTCAPWEGPTASLWKDYQPKIPGYNENGEPHI